MTKIAPALRDGAWLSSARIWRAGISSAIGTIVFVLFLAATAHGLNDYSGRPLGTDFSSFYAAGRLAQQGASPYESATLLAMEREVFGAGTPFFAFSYPPPFLLLAWLLAGFPYLVSLAIWQICTFALYLWALALLKRRFGAGLPGGLFYLCSASFTGVFVNLTHGQNGFLTAALFAAGLASLGVRPWLAGLFFGLVAYKPQFGLLIPFALAAGGHWRSFTSAAGTVLTLVAVSCGVFGLEVWSGFLAATDLSRHMILDSGGVGYAKMVSVFAWLRLWHLPLTVAYIVQFGATLLAIAVAVRLWRSDADLRLQGAALCVGALLATPYAWDYDLVLLAPAIGLLAAYEIQIRPIPFGTALLSALWLLPLFARSITSFTLVPLAAGMLIGCFLIVMKQGLSQRTDRVALP